MAMKIKLLLLIGVVALSGCLAQTMSAGAQGLAPEMAPAMAPAPEMQMNGEHRHHQGAHVAPNGEPEATRKLLWWNNWGSGQSCWFYWQHCDNQRCQCTEIINNNNNNNNGRKLLEYPWGWYDHSQNRCVCDVVVNNNNNNNNGK